ncbi:MAG: primosomal protein N', partial [Hyphomicrobiales bacterium]
MHGRGPTMIADVLMPVAVDTAYSYRVPSELAVVEGDIVVAPLGPRETIGVVWSLRAERPSERQNLKSLIVKANMPALPKTLIAFVDWAAHWTLA